MFDQAVIPLCLSRLEREGKEMQLECGTQLGPYEIQSLVGAGGMGEVYKARDSRLGRFVAIKILLAPNLIDAHQKNRFSQEARTASTLNHAGIVTVYDIGCVCGVDYIAMELVEGTTLNALIPRNGLPLNELLSYSIQAADAIATAHSVGILHRDLKPANVIVTCSGRVKVLDFGLAKLMQTSPGRAEGDTETNLQLTEAGKIMGTTAYMSPEQAEGKVLDCRSDIFSFGTVLYEMTTGQRPFQAGTAMATIGYILRDEPKPVTEIRREIPPELERLIRRCLRKDPERRIQSMSELRASLEELKQDSDSGRLAAASSAPKRKAVQMTAGFVLCSVFAGVFVSHLIPKSTANSHP